MLLIQLLDPRTTPEHLGLVPMFLDEHDPRGAKEQFDERYIGGWRNIEKAKIEQDGTMTYPGDPPLKPIAKWNLREEIILMYPHALVAIIQPDKSYEVCRMD